MKYISFIGYGLLAASVIIVIAFLASSNFTVEEYPMVDTILNWTYFMLVLAGVSAVALPMMNILKNPKAMLRSLIGFGVVAVVVLVCYLMADTTPVVTVAKDVFDNPVALLLSDTGLYATYFAFAVAVVAIVGGELFKVFKR